MWTEPMPTQFAAECLALYRRTLLDDVIPFWLRHTIDPTDGAINNCIDDAGNVLSRERYLWSQGRALWTFSALYNRVEKRPEWLDVAHGIAAYLKAHGRDDQGRWMYRLDSEGNVLDRDTSIYVDGFVANGLGEYFRAAQDEAAARLARETFECTRARLAIPGSYGIAPYVLPEGTKTLGIPMIFSFFLHNLGRALGDREMMDTAHAYAHELLADFYIESANTFRELVTLDGRAVDSPQGRVCVPGHVIEAMWFLISIFEDTGESDLIPRCCEMIRRHLELGWDDEFGGIRLAVDVEGREPVAWPKADYKPWWVQVEALVATAYAYFHTRDEGFIEWHRRVRDYAFSHYPVPTGEWTQWLDRTGAKGESAALPVKDPFHLPRGLMHLMEVWGRVN